ncbi:MAG: T9SS type A sorting domain-containing protein [Bacteroidetes bacterium]|nr:T9SS type A sorting domain-containing protein [Bacteroidota bacterium]
MSKKTKNIFCPLTLKPFKGIYFGLFILLAFFSKVDAQTLKRQCIASSGSYVTENGITLQQTIGQPYGTSPYYSNTTRYTPGFLQPVFRIENIKSSIDAKIFPNPTSNQVTIESTILLENVLIQIVDITGKILLSQKIAEFKTYTIECSDWSTGAYLISLTDSKNSLYSSKLIITR